MNDESLPRDETQTHEAPVPSPPSSGERVSVRGPSGETASSNSSDSMLTPSPRRGRPGRGGDVQSTLEPLSSPLPNPPHQGEGTNPEETPHPSPLPSKARGEGTKEDPLTLSPEDGGEGTSRATRWAILLIAASVYFATGFFTVPANEVAVVRRFGRAVLPARTSGLRFDLPWPFVRVDRINLNASRALSIGEATVEPNAFLQPASSAPTTFLTGDKNLLQLRIVVQYRVSEEFLAEWLYASERPEQRLRLLVETTATDFVSRSGVDFVHTQGLAELNNRLLMAVREQATRQRIGCEVEQVTIDRADPPARVKAEFLDVSNARADMARSVNDARSYAEQKLAESQADARQMTDAAEQARRTKGSAAQGSADRFVALVEQLRQDATSSGRDYDSSRSLTMNRLYLETLRDVLSRAKSKVVLDGQQPADIVFPQGK